MKQQLHIKEHEDFYEKIDVEELDFHPVIKDIENIFWFFLLSNKALSLLETQNILSSDENFASILKKYNKWTNLEITKDIGKPTYTTNLNALKQMVFLSKAMAILLHDFLINSKYNSYINKDSDMQFLRHIRNGAAHNNIFNMKDEFGVWKIKEDEVIAWRKKEIKRELHLKKVFPSFISIQGMFLLAKDFSDKLKAIDDTHKK